MLKLKDLKPRQRRRIVWTAVAGVCLPLITILALQYVSLSGLKRASAGEERRTQEKYLETIAEKIAYAYQSGGEDLLNLSQEEFASEAKVAAHFERANRRWARLLFIVHFRGEDKSQCLFYNPATHSMEAHPEYAEQRHVNSATASWKMLSLDETEVQPRKVRVSELDPETRIMLVPVTDEASKVIGVAGAFVDLNYFKGDYLPRVLGDFQSASSPIPPPGKVIITARDPFRRLAASTGPVKEEADEVSVPLKFIFTDWRLGIQSVGETPEEWARTNFLISLSLSLLMTVLLIAAVTLALRAARRELRLSQMKSDFVSNVSHELRTPLSSIRVFGEFFRLGWIEDGRTARECGEFIEAESRRLTQLIDNILDFSKIESNQKEYEFEETDLVEVVNEALKAFEMTLRQRKVSITFAPVEEDLPRPLIDREAITQALMNLLDNAVKYSGSGKEILVRAWAEESHINISVTDRGIGIPPGERQMIFEKFYRVSTGLVHDIKGSGLGLAIVKHIVKAHGGEVTVESEEGRGSTFVLRLPLQPRTRSEPELNSAAALKTGHPLKSNPDKRGRTRGNCNARGVDY